MVLGSAFERKCTAVIGYIHISLQMLGKICDIQYIYIITDLATFMLQYSIIALWELHKYVIASHKALLFCLYQMHL